MTSLSRLPVRAARTFTARSAAFARAARQHPRTPPAQVSRELELCRDSASDGRYRRMLDCSWPIRPAHGTCSRRGFARLGLGWSRRSGFRIRSLLERDIELRSQTLARTASVASSTSSTRGSAGRGVASPVLTAAGAPSTSTSADSS
jgi:hypothetical protein